jgi:hypothetical protein
LGVSAASTSGSHDGVSDGLPSLDMLIDVRDNASWVERRLRDILCRYQIVIRSGKLRADVIIRLFNVGPMLGKYANNIDSDSQNLREEAQSSSVK